MRISLFLYRNPRLLLLVVAVLAVLGLTSWIVMPRLEDPVLGRRVAVVSTAFPGADAERVESLVTVPLEERLRDIAEIEEIRSTSRMGIANLVLELRDSVSQVEPVWSLIRDRLADADSDLPEQALTPELEVFPLKAFAAIIALQPESDSATDMIALGRAARALSRRIRDIPGTEQVKIYGDAGEEFLISVPAESLAASGLSTATIARQIQNHNSQQPLGTLRNSDSELLLDFKRTDEAERLLGSIPIQSSGGKGFVNLRDMADIERLAINPPQSVALIEGRRAVVLGVHVHDDDQVDRWSDKLHDQLESYQRELPDGIRLNSLFSQRDFIERRLRTLLTNVLLGTLAVAGVVLLMMGWRSTLIIAAALPLSAMIVLSGLRLMGIPLHQMSITGMIIALGLLIDNAIVIVEDVRTRIFDGAEPAQAVMGGVRHLAMPLFGSTLTTTLAFVPIAMLPGAPGEFVGTIAVSVILAINASFLLAMTVLPALTALFEPKHPSRGIWSYGFTIRWLEIAYESSLRVVLRRPLIGVFLGASVPCLGYLLAQQLPEQFFPPTDRPQIHIELETAAISTIDKTAEVARRIEKHLDGQPQIANMQWFVGESAPTFFYNIVPRRRATPFYAQAMVQLEHGVAIPKLVHRLQRELSEHFPDCRIVVRQLDQGPPFDAPIEIQLQGDDLTELRRLGASIRLLLTQTPQVLLTRSDLEETVPKLELQIDTLRAREAGLNKASIAGQLYSALNGALAGSLTTGAEEHPVRVVSKESPELTLAQLQTWELLAPPDPMAMARVGQHIDNPSNELREGGIPLAALAKLQLGAEVSAISRINGQRVNEVKGYISAGVLPSTVVADFERRLKKTDFRLPAGYSMRYGGESAERDEAVMNLMANALLLFSLIVLTLVASFRSFRVTFILTLVGGLSIGLGPASLWLYGYPFGFMAIVGTMGLVGVAINDAIVVMAGIRANSLASRGDQQQILEVVVSCTRHVLATTFTTIAGFMPLILAGGGFWPPLAITIAGGVGGATILALYFVPSAYLLISSHSRS